MEHDKTRQGKRDSVRQAEMASLPHLKITMTMGDAMTLATCAMRARRKIERNRDATAKKRGGYFVPEPGRADMDLRNMERFESLAFRLIAEVPDEWIDNINLKAMKHARENGLSVPDALNNARKENENGAS